MELEKAEIELWSVELIDVIMKIIKQSLMLLFLVKNPSEKAFTVSQIDYQSLLMRVELGSGAIFCKDVALPGRAVFYPDSSNTIKKHIQINKIRS